LAGNVEPLPLHFALCYAEGVYMIDLHLNDPVLFYNMASPLPGPWPATVLAINSNSTVDLKVVKDGAEFKEYGVFNRCLAESGRMWDWPKTKVFL
jgi:hypothetical protein